MSPIARLNRRLFPLKCCLSFILGLMILAAHGAPLDRLAARDQYRDWYARFLTDMRSLESLSRDPDQLGPVSAKQDNSFAAQLYPRRDIAIETINRVFTQSVVPDSRAANLIQGFAQRPEMFRGSQTDPPLVGEGMVMMNLLQHALPAGYGGAYRNDKPIPADEGSFVWYMHLPSGEGTASIFEDGKLFTPYHLPPDGVLERKAYPFLLFREKQGKLYLAGISQELLSVISAMWATQLY